MNVLVLNSGSSSLKFQLINTKKHQVNQKGHIDGIGLATCVVKINGNESQKMVKDHAEAVKILFSLIDVKTIDAIGHRVVHGGSKYSDAIKIDDKVVEEIEKYSALAPLHNPVNLLGIKACLQFSAKIPEVAVFDTAFHQTMPKEAYSYAIPKSIAEKYSIRKYGFHGTYHKYITERMQSILGKKKVNVIVCHLGNGASITAVKDGHVIDTSMGLTPLPGLIMGTRSGDIDPEIIGFLMKAENKSVEDIMKILNKQSGLLGVAGVSDMRDVHKLSVEGNNDAMLAKDMYSYRLLSYIGSYIAVIGKVDAIVFTAGTGQGAYYIRKNVCKRLEHMGVIIDEKKNNVPWISEETKVSATKSKISVYVIPTDEEYMIAKETEKVLGGKK